MFIGFLLIIARSFEVSGTGGDRAHVCPTSAVRRTEGAWCGIQVNAEISTPSSLPSSRSYKYVAGVKNCYAQLLMGFETEDRSKENSAFCHLI
ncbi:MAG: hypothetical protein LH628_08300 [Microcoleus sp. CAN_BIN18]|nr:hypothetical protein [Microcoleus sp. CAN_BIN18]